MQIDHIYIFSDQQGIEAQQLVDFGLTEGSSRRHPGQGTTNRKFYFDNFFLEILWVVDEEEIQSKLTSPTGLWERSQFRTNGASRFGLCLVNTAETDALFSDSFSYQPSYFPKGGGIDMITHVDQPHLPTTFRLPFQGQQAISDEPMDHPQQLQQLTKATFGLPTLPVKNPFLQAFNEEAALAFEDSDNLQLLLEFDHGRQRKQHYFKELDLLIRF